MREIGSPMGNSIGYRRGAMQGWDVDRARGGTGVFPTLAITGGQKQSEATLLRVRVDGIVRFAWHM